MYTRSTRFAALIFAALSLFVILPYTVATGPVDQPTAGPPGDQEAGDDINGEGMANTRKYMFIAGTAVLGGTVCIFAAPVVLGAVGFGSGGVVATSIAAGIQSTIGNVAAGSAFAALQSVGAAGLGTAGTAAVGAAGAAAAGAGATVATAII